MTVTDGASRPLGRPPATSRELVERAAIDLMLTEGYEAVSVARIAAAAGIARSTFFRYFQSKSDAVWGAFDVAIERLGVALAAAGPDVPVMAAIRAAVADSTVQAARDSEVWLGRFALLDTSPSLRAEAALHWSRWSAVVADFVAARVGATASDVLPAAIAGAVQSAYLASLRTWLASGAPDGEPLAFWTEFAPVGDALDQVLARTPR